MAVSRDIASLIDLHQFPTGRRLFALRRVHERVRERDGDPGLLARIEAAIAQDERTRALEVAWRAQSDRTQHGVGAQALDAELDRSLSALDQVLAAQLKAFGPEHERHQAAAALREAAFPNGLGAVTSLPYVLEAEEVRRILDELRRPAMVQAVDRLGLTPQVEGIAELNQRYGELLSVNRVTVSFDQVAQARAEGQARLAWLVVYLVVAFDEDPDARAAVLAPVFEQDEAIARSRKGRRPAADVDPQTGEETDEANDDGPQPTAAEPRVANPALPEGSSPSHTDAA
jgi:Family of unknown function (DUF6261)